MNNTDPDFGRRVIGQVSQPYLPFLIEIAVLWRTPDTQDDPASATASSPHSSLNYSLTSGELLAMGASRETQSYSELDSLEEDEPIDGGTTDANHTKSRSENVNGHDTATRRASGLSTLSPAPSSISENTSAAGSRWSDYELYTLASMWQGNTSFKAIAARLPGRTPKGCAAKVNALKKSNLVEVDSSGARRHGFQDPGADTGAGSANEPEL